VICCRNFDLRFTGEAQHLIIRRHPDPLPAQSKIVSTPWQVSTCAASITALLALVGKSRPGVFLKTTAYLGAANLSISVCDVYAQREINRGIFKLDNIEPKAGKLWERTKHWSVDDLVVGGGVLGTFLALHPRALPGVWGWKRFFGAATVGGALGGYVGETRLFRLPSQLLDIMHAADKQTRQVEYDRLKEDKKAKESLSRFGRAALALYTWPIWDILINPLARSTGQVSGAKQNPHANITRQEMEQYSLIQLEFNKGELKGPDIENGYRAYKDSIEGRDVGTLQEWLEHLQDLRKITAAEAQYLWQYLAVKEHKFYDMVEDEKEKDIVRREIQLLNNISSDFTMRDAVFAYHIADVRKRLGQIEQARQVEQTPDPVSQSIQDEPSTQWEDHHSLRLVVEQVRINWTRQKEVLNQLEQHTSMFKDFQVEPGSAQEAQLKQVRQNAEDMKRNVEATERLLREFEEQTRRADAYVKPVVDP
jgi:hypothetical protein